MIQVILEDIGVDSIKDHCAAFSGSRAYRAKHVGTDMVSEIRHLWPAAPSAPAPPRTRIAFNAAFVGKPYFEASLKPVAKVVYFLARAASRACSLLSAESCRNCVWSWLQASTPRRTSLSAALGT